MPLQNTTLEGVLTIDGISMNIANGAWGVIGDKTGAGGLVHLWSKFNVRGEDRVLPGVTGVIPYRRRITSTRCDLRLLIAGDVIGQTGLAASDAIVGLATNVTYLTNNVLVPVASPTGTRAATLTIPGLATRSAAIHVLGMEVESYMLSECGSGSINTLQIQIPGGRFT